MTENTQRAMDLGMPSAEQERERRRKAEREDAHVLVTGELMELLRKNHRKGISEIPPALKIFSPVGAATWLIHSIEDDQDTMFGLCDLGMGSPEMGNVSLNELLHLTINARIIIEGEHEMTVPYRMERDLYFHPEHPLEVYAEAAHRHKGITEMNGHLEEAARRLEWEKSGRRRRR